jgi:hypothetical protein
MIASLSEQLIPGDPDGGGSQRVRSWRDIQGLTAS